MQVLPINIASLSTTVSPSNTVSSNSRDIASSTLIPSVTVSLSSNRNAQAAANISVPPIYTRVSVGATINNQLSPSRNSIERPIAVQTSNQDVTETELIVPPIETNRAAPEENDEPEQGKNQSNDAAQVSERRQMEGQAQAPGELTKEQLDVVQALQARDREVRAHEQAHKSVGGALAGAVSYTYQSGPNGQRYAVGGEVPIDASPISGDPAATIRKMNIVRAAATAPIDPSAQDLRVAATASRVLAQAQKDLLAENIANRNTQAGESTQDESQRMNSAESDTNADKTRAETPNNFESEYDAILAPLVSKSAKIDTFI